LRGGRGTCGPPALPSTAESNHMLDEKIPPMLAYAAEPFDSPRHVFEIKWDGARCLLFKRGREIRLQNRRLDDITWRYPDLAGLHRHIKAKNAILDGELVALVEGKADFRRLQQREQLTDPFKIDLASRRVAVTYVAFDVLYGNDKKYLDAPLMDRKAILQGLLGESPRLVESRYIEEKGKAFFAEAVKLGLEGVMAKSRASPYLPGKRSRFWLKIKAKPEAECFIIGFKPGQGGRAGFFGSLLLATREKEGLVYRGRVGSGFTEFDLEDISARLKALRAERPPLAQPPRLKDARWVKPRLRCEISFLEKTPRGHFRAPVFKRLVE